MLINSLSRLDRLTFLEITNMAINYNEEVDAYYAAKETYTEYLQKAADELSQGASSSENHASAEEKEGCDSWFLQGKSHTAALAQLAKKSADLMKDTKTDKKQPEELESKVKSKGKKK